MIGPWGRAASAAIVMSACSLGFDGENYQGASGAGPTGPCAPGTLHAPAVPDGWQGPVQIANASDEAALPACPFVSSVVHDELTSEPFECACRCALDTTKCTAAVGLFLNGSSCDGLGQPLSLPANMCQEVGGMGITSGETTWQPMGDPCIGVADNTPPPTPTWSTHTLLCAASGTPLDDGSVCASLLSGFDQVMCIYAEGGGECPAAFPERMGRHRSHRDDRSCAPCTCAGGACGGTIVFTPDDTECASVDTTPIPPNVCTGVSAPTGKASAIYAAEGVGACMPSSAGEIQGELIPTDPLVVCCTQ